MRDSEHPFFRPLWRRVAVTVLCAGWAAVEFSAHSPGWGMVALGFTAYAVWQFFWLHGKTTGPAGEDEKE